ncbi:hypothetical protein [Priestia megaterium]|uniref:hypothetical protein n=1 Tax=Priestia megaterium TaxID=1404 RepID=UPI000BF4EC58|nr:hypothetical protein [Priestia megaterium]PFJ03202.1 hypothetical protein COI84_02625 [Priestia megaterium]PGR11737.1 hypothetical protein COC62_14030 [Priestia megaterium]
MLKGFFDGLREHRQKQASKREYDYLEQTPYLHSSSYLRNLYTRSSNDDQCSQLADYMERFNVTGKEYKGYHNLYRDINSLYDEGEE